MVKRKSPEEVISEALDDESIEPIEAGELGEEIAPETEEEITSDNDEIAEDDPDDEELEASDEQEATEEAIEAAPSAEEALLSEEEREKKKEQDAAKKAEEEVYKEPEGLGEQASERFQKLVSDNKAVKTRNAELEYSSKVLADTIGGFGRIDDDQMKALQGFSRNLNSGTPEGLRAAWDTLQDYQKRLATMLGVSAPGFDPLKLHPDLQQKVEEFEIKKDEALKQAETRAEQRIREANEKVQKQQQQFEKFKADFQADVSDLEQKWVSDIGVELYQKPLFQGPDNKLVSMQSVLGQQLYNLTQQMTQRKITPRQFFTYAETSYNRLKETAKAHAGQVQRAPAQNGDVIDDYKPVERSSNNTNRQRGGQTGFDSWERSMGWE